MENHELLSHCCDYKTETYEEALARYDGFGKGFYEALVKRYPKILKHLTFYQQIRDRRVCVMPYGPQTEDSYAIYNDGTTAFGIQLNFYTEIVLYDNDKDYDIGYWYKNPIEIALAYLKRDFLPNSILK
ncbi:hypothetical protein [Flavobacterium beibuense]|uniref:Uncharacterized protein n=1 Tax=Flavobacterium beibuense F44-8 TaxID=1406840 RepID=A0A0A2LXA9_9FLAO|nr:hypothetical protein [Flavobacterium beibuense]KGO80745.1 hypothetical protein Q763_09400 [Flavobacterium beibuense F44-8]